MDAIDIHPDTRILPEPEVSERPQARLAEAVEAYVSFKVARGAPESTTRTCHYLLLRMVREVGDLQMRNLRPHHLRDWFYGPRGMMSGSKRLEPSTHNTYRAMLRGFFDWATRRGMVKYDLLEDVRPLKEPRKRRLQPKPDILLRMLDSTDTPRDRIYLAVALNTALRTSEITRMKVGDVDLYGGVMDVTRSKGGEEDQIPITADLMTEFERWFQYYEEAIDVPLSPEHWLFPVYSPSRISHWETLEDGTRRMVHAPRQIIPDKQWNIRTEEVIKKALRAVGLPTKGQGTHTIRRAVARAYFDSLTTDAGYDAALRTVAALLGHARTSTTERYLGLSTERARRDASMQGKPFLTAMVPTNNVRHLRAVD